jgi:hypothetical protein
VRRPRLPAATGTLLAACALVASAHAAACEARLDGGQRVESTHYALAFRPVPAPIEVGRHFALDVVVCARAAADRAGALAVDARMPEHRHGMNYRPSVTERAAGVFRAEGLMFHMPGRWQFVFEVRDARGAERLTHDHWLR